MYILKCSEYLLVLVFHTFYVHIIFSCGGDSPVQLHLALQRYRNPFDSIAQELLKREAAFTDNFVRSPSVRPCALTVRF